MVRLPFQPKLKHLLHNIGTGLQETIAPARCIRCLRVNTWACLECRNNLDVTFPLRCIGCNAPSPQGTVCLLCRDLYIVRGVAYATSYRVSWAKRATHWLKFKGIESVAPAMAQLMIPRLPLIAPLNELQRQAILTPIPLHPRRLRQRGFNQSEALTRAVSKQTGIRWQPLLTRQRVTKPQAKLPHHLRQQNVAEAFGVVDHALSTDTLVIIVDDVTTTGATLNAAAQALHQSGIKTIWGLTFARG